MKVCVASRISTRDGYTFSTQPPSLQLYLIWGTEHALMMED